MVAPLEWRYSESYMQYETKIELGRQYIIRVAPGQMFLTVEKEMGAKHHGCFSSLDTAKDMAQSLWESALSRHLILVDGAPPLGTQESKA